ncbi:unnamed protein product [Rhizophagus irregularis]|nr:unnamed protein product [Rhizophagus irregularis]
MYSPGLSIIYYEINTRQHFNDLNDEIIFNHTYDEDDFAMIRRFKEEQLPAVHVPTDEDYRCDMSRIDLWYIKRRSKLKETKTAKRKRKQEEKKRLHDKK